MNLAKIFESVFALLGSIRNHSDTLLHLGSKATIRIFMVSKVIVLSRLMRPNIFFAFGQVPRPAEAPHSSDPPLKHIGSSLPSPVLHFTVAFFFALFVQ